MERPCFSANGRYNDEMATLLNHILKRLRTISHPNATATSIAEERLGITRDHLSKLERGSMSRPVKDLLDKMLDTYEASPQIREAVTLLFNAVGKGLVTQSSDEATLRSFVETTTSDPALQKRYILRDNLWHVLKSLPPTDEVVFLPDAVYDFFLGNPTSRPPKRSRHFTKMNSALFAAIKNGVGRVFMAPPVCTSWLSPYLRAIPHSALCVGNLYVLSPYKTSTVPDASDKAIADFDEAFLRVKRLALRNQSYATKTKRFIENVRFMAENHKEPLRREWRSVSILPTGSNPNVREGG